VRVKLQESARGSIADVSKFVLKSGKNDPGGVAYQVPLSDVADISYSQGPSQIKRYARQREIRIDGAMNGSTLGEALAEIKTETDKLQLEPGYSISVIGEGQMQEESFGNIFASLILAIIFVYIVLAAQFDHFVHPFSIMLALPMSIIGAALFLFLFGSTVSMMSLIGIIMLMGLVTKNGILLVDYTNVLRERGLNRYEALLQAGPTRLRPILMTSLAMIFGMIPVAAALGEGSEFRAPMGQAVIGGILTSTLLTLFIVPVVYTILDDLSFKKFFSKFRKKNNQKKNNEG
jgi:HAE1 family hydrophobic/amphiphilic exporter-1